MSKEKIEMSVELNGQEVVAYPYVNSDHVLLDNNMTIDKMLESDVVEPVITHEEVSFKVGQGDSDLSDSIVDSSAGGFTVKGQTYQNILPEPSLRNSMTNGKTMQKLNEGYDSVNTVDGVCKSAILSGNTLVNLIKDGYMPSSTTNSQNAIASIVPLDGSKEYTLMLNKNLVQVNIRFWYTDGSYGDDYAFSNRAESGYIKNKLRIDRANATGKTLENIQIYSVDKDGEITNIILLEGDYTSIDVPYFEGMQSVKMPVLTTTGKNLINMDNFHTYYNGIITARDVNSITFNAPNEWAGIIIDLSLKPNTEYYLSYDRVDSNTTTIIRHLNDENVPTGETDGGENSFKVITKDNGKIRISIESKIIQNDVTLKNIQLEEGSIATSYEPFKSNILHTPEEVVLKGIGDLKDTLNCNTGEYVERIKEVVYTGDEDWKSSAMATTPDNIAFYIPLENYLDNTNNVTMRNSIKDNLGFTNNCLSATVNVPELNGVKGFSIHTNGNAYFTIPTSECANVESWKTKLREQHLVLQYATTPVIKTVDLSSSGNWEKIVLDGRQGAVWQEGSINAFYVRENRLKKLQNYSQAIISDTGSVVKHYGSFVDGCNEVQITGYLDTQNKYPNENWLYIRVPNIKSDVNALKQYLSQNPITVWFQTTTHQESTQVKQPIFFEDGHIQLSSGADNSLIPTLDYQAKTSNSYVMDLMKTNTKYTMKAKSASGNFTIDGTQYNFNTNGTFTTPSTMSNKLMIANGTVTDLMILEGDVTDKTIPYFKGIKSAFEDEDKIEVLSTGKNLAKVGYDIGEVQDGYIKVINETTVQDIDYTHRQGVIEIKPNTTYTCSWVHLSGEATVKDSIAPCYAIYDKDMNVLKWASYTTTTPSNAKYIGRVRLHWRNSEAVFTNFKFAMQLEESPTATSYEPYKSNSTKIPLLSPLRSLPNGVRDEVILDRENNKAKIIQRVGKVVLDGSEDWNSSSYSHDKLVEFVYHGGVQMAHTVFSDRFATGGVNVERVAFSGRSIYIRILKTKASNVDSFKKWLSQNPLTVQYGLDTPVITEVDLEGYPYIYKDGHVFLNTDIAPTTTIKYSINQAQVIQSQNSDIIRHSKEITNLHRLISEYVQVQYESTLLNLKVKMRA